MIFRLTKKMAKKIKQQPPESCPPAANPYTDWSVHLFSCERLQYIIVTNTASLYSMVLYGRGISDSSRFVEYALEYMEKFLSKDGFEEQFRWFIVPDAEEIIFSKLTDRHVIGSMNEFIYMAKWFFVEDYLSIFEASKKINEIPMSLLKYYDSKMEFSKLKDGISK
jgi:hypothetical protein